MFGCNKKKNTYAVETLDTSPPAINEQQLSAALNDIASGKYNDFACPNGSLRDILSAFTAKIEQAQQSSLNNIVGLSMSLSESVIAGASISKSASDINSQASCMSAATQELTASVDQIAQSTEDVSSETVTMNDISRSNMETSNTASREMQHVSKSVAETKQRLDSLLKASENIANVVGFISDIAGQTNLLALNATIEAARAGDAGKGFAVVAHEVKELATKTAENAQQITESVHALQREVSEINQTTQKVVDAVELSEAAITSSSEGMEQILSVAASINEKTQSIAGILQEQKLASNEIAEGVALVTNMTEENIVNVGQTLDAMDQSESMLVAELNELAKLQINNATVYLAKSDHIIWKKRLANMLVGRDSLAPDELADHHTCRLGKWYDTITDPKYKDCAAYTQILEPHKKVHYHGIKAAKKYNAGDLNGAIENVKAAELASVDVIRLLDEIVANAK